MKKCGKAVKTAKNGVNRGKCTLLARHSGGDHVNSTCLSCGRRTQRKTDGRCRECYNESRRQKQHQKHSNKPMNFQMSGSSHTFPRCGCSGILPARRSESNLFTRSVGGRSWQCRVGMILLNSRRDAVKWAYVPIDINTSHSVIRKLMEIKICWRCKQPLEWVFGSGKTPHLHHDHKTGEIYGFTHPRCNLQALEHEIGELKVRDHKQEREIVRLRMKLAETAPTTLH